STFHITLFACLFFCSSAVFGQFIPVEGYVYAANNTGFLNEVKISVLDENNALIAETTSNLAGIFNLELLEGKNYRIRANKPGFNEGVIEWSSVDKTPGEKIFLKLPLDRAPGYILEVTMAELADPEDDGEVDAITGALIEIYNNTTDEEALVLKDHPNHLFSFMLEQGNSYTAMIRKEGFYTKRMELDVAVDGCILCMDGFGEVNPGVSENLTMGNVSGTLGANVNLQRVEIGEAIVLSNIYYDLGKADIRPDAAIELDKIVGVLKDNQKLIVEISSHTDSRGSNSSNQELSERRAKSAVDYLVGQGVERSRLAHKGYGESKLRNKCKDGVECSEKQHQKNRRTEFTVIGFKPEDPYDKVSLKEIIEEERLMEEIMNLDKTIIQIAPGEAPPSNTEQPEVIEEKIDEPKPTEEKPESKPIQNDLLGGMETVKVEAGPEIVMEDQATSIDIDPQSEIEAENDEVLEERTKANDESVASSKPLDLLSNVKMLDAGFSGYKIKVISVSSPLSADHRIFREFGDLVVYQSGQERFHYLVGDFEKEGEAKDFLERNISQRFPNAAVIHFVDGKRLD
ncbi:MAG: OmpA family protein, partial [Bacteroidota bacterium]